MTINWTSAHSHWCLNPDLTLEQKKLVKRAQQELPELPGHLWFMTSGSSTDQSRLKIVALSKSAFLAAAQAANNHLQVTASDRWLLVLPEFHVGGVGLMARAHLSSSDVDKMDWKSWDPHRATQAIEKNSITLASFVPTHIFDLVRAGLRAPVCLRAIVVGGGALTNELYFSARQLGWPLLPSYGMTETAAQVATAELASLKGNVFPRLKILEHIRCKTTSSDELLLQGPSLLTGRAFVGSQVVWEEHKKQEWFSTGDHAKIVQTHLIFLGREGRRVKIFGEMVDLDALEEKFAQTLGARGPFRVVALPDHRKGNSVALVLSTEQFHHSRRALNQWCRLIKKFELPDAVFYVRDFPTSPLGKILDGVLLRQIGF